MPDLFNMLQLLLIPVVGLLWRISGQLATVAATTAHHAEQLQQLRDVPSRLAVLESWRAHHQPQPGAPHHGT